MKTNLLLGMLFLWSISCACLSAQNTSDFSVKEHCLPIADPYILYYNDCYYAYGTNAQGFAVYLSSDLKHWRRNEVMALSPEDSWGDKGYWAPEVYYIPSLKKFYMYYTVNEQVCVATSDSPEGPFVQDVKKPLWGVEKNIDPSLFIDSDGKAYLYFVRFTGGNVIWCAELNADLKSLKEDAVITVLLSNGTKYPLNGKVELMNYEANQNTDTVQIYALFENPEGKLIPNSTVTVTMTKKNGLKRSCVPMTAVQHDADGAYVWFLGEGKRAEKSSSR